MVIKAKDLWIPVSFKERRPLLLDQFFYLPSHFSGYEKFPLPPLSSLFGKEAPVAIEYCSGNGEWIIEKAKAHPEYNWIAVEKRIDRVRKIWARGKNANLKNLLTVFGEAKTFTEHYLGDSSISRVYINFPDPWPKNRHSKHRLVQKPFALLLKRVLEPLGEAIFVTDDPEYSQQMIDAMLKESGWKSASPPPYYLNEWKNFGMSYFLDLWQKKNLSIHYHRFINFK